MSEPGGPQIRVDLTSEPDFGLGALRLSPSTGRAAAHGVEERVEPKVMEVLVVLARAGGRTVSRDQLVEACWDGRAVSEDAISRTIAKVRQLARTWDPAPYSIETVPKLGFRLIVAEAEAAAAAQAGEAPAAAEAASGPDPKRAVLAPLRPLILGAAGLIAAVAATWAFWPKGPAPTESAAFNPSFEVAEFKPMHQEAELSLLGSRTSATMTRLLAQNGHPARETVAGEPAMYRIAGIVDHTDGSYSIDGQIIHAPSGLVLWSTRAERREADVAGIDAEVGYALVGALGCALDERRRPTGKMSEEVFGLLLNACASAIFASSDALVATRRLIEAAPDFSGGYGQLAIVATFNGMITQHNPALAEALKQEGLRAADRAEQLDPTSPKPHLARAIALGQSRLWQEREAHLQRAIELQPSFLLGRDLHGQLLRETGRLRAARESLNRTGESIDPRIIATLPFVAFLNATQGDFEEANRVSQTLSTIFPRLSRRVQWTIEFWWSPRLTPARLRELHQGSPAELACFETVFGRVQRGETARGLPPGCEALQIDWRIRLMGRQGDVDGVYAELARRPENGLTTIMFVFYPEMKKVRHDPRFMPLMKEVGLLDFWRQSGRWPDFCAEPDLPYDCKAFGG